MFYLAIETFGQENVIQTALYQKEFCWITHPYFARTFSTELAAQSAAQAMNMKPETYKIIPAR